MQQKVFPITSDTACQLKWNYSTVYLNMQMTASCCMAHNHRFDLESFDFHNTPAKIQDRQRMIQGQWPQRGCEFCSVPESQGHTSDRTIFNDWPEQRPPPEFDHDPTAVRVTPRTLQLYWGNRCNLKCVYCSPGFSSKINGENRQYGAFKSQGVVIPGHQPFDNDSSVAVDKFFDWLELNIQHLDHLMILGGEPLIQKETDRLFDFLSTVDCTNLKLHINSNLMVPHAAFQKFVAKLDRLRIREALLIGSLDSTGAAAEYIRSGLNFDLWQQNFEYALYHSNINLNVHTTLTCLGTQNLPALVRQINQWSVHRPVFWNVKEVQGKPYLDYRIFGPWLLDQGLHAAIDLYNPEQNPDKQQFKHSYLRFVTGVKNSVPDLKAQAQLQIYLAELDRRRGTDFRAVFSEVAAQLDIVPLA